MLSLREHIKSEPHIVQNKLLNTLLPFFIAFPCVFQILHGVLADYKV